MQVRRLRNEDILALQSILKNFDVTGNNHLPSEAHLNSLLGNDTCYLIAALEPGNPIGYVLAYKFPSFYAAESTAYLYDIEVLPAHRNKGIGKQLIRLLMDHLARDGVTEVWLGTGINNSAAQKLFTGTGAEKEEETFYEYFYYLDGAR